MVLVVVGGGGGSVAIVVIVVIVVVTATVISRTHICPFLFHARLSFTTVPYCLLVHPFIV